MTGNRRAAPAASATPTHLPNATTTAAQRHSEGHSPNKFMSELHSIHSELNASAVRFWWEVGKACGKSGKHCFKWIFLIEML